MLTLNYHPSFAAGSDKLLALLYCTPSQQLFLSMLSQVFYLVRSRADGQYLVAHPTASASRAPNQPETGYLLMFQEHFDALSYLNTHATGVVDRFAIESLPGTQLNGLLKRWGFAGVGIVRDPLFPQIEFLMRD